MYWEIRTQTLIYCRRTHVHGKTLHSIMLCIVWIHLHTIIKILLCKQFQQCGNKTYTLMKNLKWSSLQLLVLLKLKQPPWKLVLTKYNSKMWSIIPHAKFLHKLFQKTVFYLENEVYAMSLLGEYITTQISGTWTKQNCQCQIPAIL